VIAIMGAVNAEISQVKKAMVVEQSISGQDCSLFVGTYVDKHILLARSGVGKQRAEGCVQTILDDYPVKTLINLGFGGALSSQSNIGDLIICKKFLSTEGQSPKETFYSDQELVKIAVDVMERVPATPHIGNCLTAGFLVSRPEDKQSMGTQFNAQVVDMESYWTARIAKKRAVRFLGVRAISDSISERMPPFDRLMNPEGKVIFKTTARYFLTHPADLLNLFHLYLNARKASASLTRFIHGFLHNLNN
jgi:adenosylhomocysteine nucleosidase